MSRATPLARVERGVVALRMASGRKRVLVVNCYVDETRQAMGRSHKVPQAMAPVYLAAALAPQRCDVRLYSELAQGPLEDEGLLAWPDMLVLTGLTTALDRMRQVTAYARTKNPRVIVVAGGHAVRALPRYCRRFFDYCCEGDVEDLAEVVADAFGRDYVAAEPAPRFDLCPWLGKFGYVETSRNCNFHCRFCTLTAERRPYRATELAAVRDQMRAVGARTFVVFVDNNFYGPDRDACVARMEMLRELWRAKRFLGWAALVTNDFFFDPRNLQLAREAGCVALFSGVESFDTTWLRRSGKRQNTRRPQEEIIRATLDAGIAFLYGLVLDVTARRTAEMRDELETILAQPDLTLPAYCSVSIPILGTPFFYDCLDAGRVLPGTRVRDLDGTTLSVRPQDPVPEVATFVRDLQRMRGFRRRVLRHSAGFVRRYAGRLAPHRIGIALTSPALLCVPQLVTTRQDWGRPSSRRTHVSTTDVLDPQYRPAFPVDARYARHFGPTMLTDARGTLAEDVAEDVLAARAGAAAVKEVEHVAGTG